MSGTAGRSGGRNAKFASNVPFDGIPQTPRVLSPRAQALFAWLCERLDVEDPAKGWRRADGILLASIAELMESQEKVASALADDPTSLGLHRLRNNLTQQVSRLSSLIGLCPFDRSRMPTAAPEDDNVQVFQDIMERMARGQ